MVINKLPQPVGGGPQEAEATVCEEDFVLVPF